ncbi:hypothetical protein B0H13DRAFT_1860283 [Mycena leptocephala]|nr:hypothetical protein B0H13DRAFT_1860283 [Mycena leptocephala]
MDSGTSYLQVSIKHKVSGARTTTSHVNPGRDSLEEPPNIPAPRRSIGEGGLPFCERSEAIYTKGTSGSVAMKSGSEGTLLRHDPTGTKIMAGAEAENSLQKRKLASKRHAILQPPAGRVHRGVYPVPCEPQHPAKFPGETEWRTQQTFSQLGPHFALPPSLPDCVQGLLRVDEINYTSVVIDPAATAGVEPTGMDIMGDQHHQKGGIFSRSTPD